MANKKCNTLDDINDILIVRKITERESTSLSAKESLEEEILYESDLDRVQHLLAEEQEVIARKQLQLLQADERGKQALISEISTIKQKHEKRAELLRYRQNALNIEKERAKRIALLPPPLPKSVKNLLKNYDEPKPDKPDVQMPDELKVFHIKGVDSRTENKENILDPKELEAKQKMQDEWQMKAKKRFNDALKKDRQKEEYSKIMKQIQNSELHNRLEMAKSISSEKKCIPCPLSDKFQTVKRQTDMEDAAEKLFKKMNNREHVIEDIEGYQDYYEEKYKKIDSDLEHKMIDCIPNFVKENYEYLLEDESKFQGGKNFSGLDDSNDVFNEAYIDMSPDADTLDGREKIDLAINQLDKLRSHLQTEYDQTLKPLLVASLDIPKKELSDKAVETELIKLPIEDKAVETDVQYEVQVTPPPYTDFSRNRIMAFKRRHNGLMLGSFKGMHIPDMHRREVHYTMPAVSQSEILTPSSWSSSSYCSLPSQHGIPSFPSTADSIKCDICVAEMKKGHLPQELPQDTVSSGKEKCDKSPTSSGKPQLSAYVEQLAKKYLVAKSTSGQSTKEEVIKSHQGDSSSPMYSDTGTVCSAFEREIIPKSKIEFVVPQKSEKVHLTRKEKLEIKHPVYQDTEKADYLTIAEDEVTTLDPKETLVKQIDIIQETQENKCDDIYKRLKNYESSKSPGSSSPEYSEYDTDAKRIQLIKQVLSKRIPRISFDLETSQDKQGESTSLLGQDRYGVQPHIYHELSTIQEMDSALASGSFHASLSKLSDISIVKDGKESIPKEISKEDLELSGDRLKAASLLDPPDTTVAELAKSIQFVAKTQEEPVQPLESPLTVNSECVETASTSSKDDKLMLSSLKSDSSLDSPMSVSLAGKLFSSSLAGNVKYLNLKDAKLLPQYFSNVSDIPKIVSSIENYTLSPSLLPSEFHSSVSSPMPGSSLSIPSSIDEKSKRKTDTVHSVISGFIDSLLSSASQSTLKKTEIISKDKDTVISGFIQDSPVPTSIHTEPDMENKKDNIPSLISGYISNTETSDTSGSRQFEVMTPHYDISSPGIKSDVAKHQSDAPSLISGVIDHFEASDKSSSRMFRAMTPHSDISSPSVRSTTTKQQLNTGEKKDFPSSRRPVKYGRHIPLQSSSSNSSGDFQLMTPHSYVSSPGERFNITSQSNFDGYSSSAENFKALTPISMVSSPSLPADEVELKSKNVSSGSSEFHPMNVRLDISTNSLSSSSSNNQSNANKKLPHLNCHFTLKAQVLGHPKCLESFEKSKQKVKSAVSKTETREKKIYYISESHGNVHIQGNDSDEIRAKENIKVCSSDFFIPQLHQTKPVTEAENNKCNSEGGTLRDEIDASKPKSTVDSLKMVFPEGACSSSQYEDKLQKLRIFKAETVDSHEEIISDGCAVKEKIKNCSVKKDLDVPRNFNKQQTKLDAISSTSSSTENLSEISSSKVLYQSTPIKSFEEIAQEPGILEEPDLTLITTEYSCKVDTPEKPRNPSRTAELSLNEERDCTIISSENDCKTPINHSPQPFASADTPSLISFLHHEVSCRQTDDSADPVLIESPSSTPDEFERKMQTKEIQKTQFPGSEYKQRTKRLWNNLEEVKKKKSAEEKKKLMAFNRLKAKEYAMKLTPKRKM